MKNKNKQNEVLITLRGGVKTYNKGKHNEITALDGVDLEIKNGEALSVMGVSGSGKSTLLNILGCVDGLSSGEFNFDGVDLSEFNESIFASIRREKIGYILQNGGLIEELTVNENLELALIIRKKMKKGFRKESIKCMLEQMELKKFGRTKVKDLSGGQKQRVAIGRAILSQPSLILADEPTSALDVKTAQSVINMLLELNAKGATLIVVTHDPRIAEMFGRVVSIVDGKIIEGKG